MGLGIGAEVPLAARRAGRRGRLAPRLRDPVRRGRRSRAGPRRGGRLVPPVRRRHRRAHRSESGPTEQVLRSPAHPYTEALLRVAAPGSVEVLPGGPPPTGAKLPGCRFADRCPYAEDRCTAGPWPRASANARFATLRPSPSPCRICGHRSCTRSACTSSTTFSRRSQ
ncbi:oligopeptide/dipeptide ABC transporter ATP-binding protein [Actinoallomurus sp. NPDC050550]|uniref:oligopeptide/dipeptide ABC transporter ATP-binding protein n=1 Tax=Actinoallomurus sp. NPDC050550 TaxID=3154937 RepID=UPI0033E5C0AA